MFRALRYQLRELSELGPSRSVYRLQRELQLATGAYLNAAPPQALLDRVALRGSSSIPTRGLPFEAPGRVADVMRDRIPPADRAALLRQADLATKGKILAFGRWTADYGSPIDWHVNPTNGLQWDRALAWNRVLRDEPTVGDVKLTWEIGRFPHAYHLARAAAHHPEHAERLGWAFVDHVLSFSSNNPFPNGVHWNSGQEIVIRYVAWLFAVSVFDSLGVDTKLARAAIARRVPMVGAHLKAHFEYARLAVYNNHLIAEALGLYLIGRMFPGTVEGDSWRDEGQHELERQTTEQFSADGAYIQNAHNYHRVALQYYLLAMRLAEVDKLPPSAALRSALERSLDFLCAHQNPGDGRLPNYGSNDGALPLVLDTCNFSDFRPALQAVSIACRGERLYEPGPWDEDAAWLFGADSLDCPLRKPARTSVCFESGYTVLRSADEDTFATLRCGTLRDRFSQIDMLTVDAWWHGQNVLIDPGSYLYNGPAKWHDYFVRTASHNTVALDDADQMIHLRRFKFIYWTAARVLDFRSEAGHAVCTAEHYGYQRLPGKPVHRRSVLLVGSDLIVVADTITGGGEHDARLHWLCGEFPAKQGVPGGPVTLTTPKGDLTVHVFDGDGHPESIDLACGDEATPRGWSSRYYGERVAVPSLVARRRGPLPLSFLTVIAPADHAVTRTGDVWVAGPQRVRFTVRDGAVIVLPAA